MIVGQVTQADILSWVLFSMLLSRSKGNLLFNDKIRSVENFTNLFKSRRLALKLNHIKFNCSSRKQEEYRRDKMKYCELAAPEVLKFEMC